jgi:hypothetical protein
MPEFVFFSSFIREALRIHPSDRNDFMRRLPRYCGLTCTTLAMIAGFALHELSLEDGRAADPNSAGPRAKGTAGRQNKSTRNKSSADATALRAQRAMARRAAIADEDIYGSGYDSGGYSSAAGRANGNSFGGSAVGGSTFGSGMGPFFGSAAGGSQGFGSSAGTGVSAGTATSGTGTQTPGAGSGTTGGQGQPGTGSATIPALNQAVLDFAVSNIGKQVGSGQCWELGAEALAYANAEPPRGQVFGDVVPLTSMLPGDILEFNTAHFVGAGYWLSLGAPYHTAIVSGVQGTSVAMLNQNVNNVKLVQITIIHLADLQSGTITVYRPAARQ